MFNSAIVLVLLSAIIVPAVAMRKDSSSLQRSLAASALQESLDLHGEAYNETSGKLVCSDYCVKCSTGATIWYGRSRNWMKMGSVVAGGVVGAGLAALAATVIGTPVAALGGAAIIGAKSGAFASAVITHLNETDRETHTHWSGNVPTSGLFCERTDIIKFADQMETCLMRTTASEKFENALKPYITDSNVLQRDGFIKEDLDNYKEGCKIVKGGGTRGLKQVLPGRTDGGVLQCSAHSKLCGPGGSPAFVKATSASECAKLANK